jgi:hypothetical protein
MSARHSAPESSILSARSSQSGPASIRGHAGPEQAPADAAARRSVPQRLMCGRARRSLAAQRGSRSMAITRAPVDARAAVMAARSRGLTARSDSRRSFRPGQARLKA